MRKNECNKFVYNLGSADKYGAICQGDEVTFTFPINSDSVKLCIFNNDVLIDSIKLCEYKVNDNLASVSIKGIDIDVMSYSLEENGKSIIDPFIMDTFSLRKYKEISNKPIKGKIYKTEFNWENDKPLRLKMNEIIAYQLHVRGFTAHVSSKVKNRGKYEGIIEKIPYFKELGINQVILMPTYEFYEFDEDKKKSFEYVDYRKNYEDSKESKHILNYWGFKEGSYYMPKISYASINPVIEFKKMVKALHQSEIEVVMRFYFPDSYNKSLISDVLKFWHKEYHIDGFYLMGNDIPMDVLASDLFLRDAKLYSGYFNKDAIVNKPYGYNHNIAMSDKEFSICMRKYLKSDEDMLQSFLYRQRHNPYDVHSLNFITDYEGFTLNDLVSYDYKHNEANLEDNRDGENYNYSWNCGHEGFTRKKSVVSLRIKQIKNAMTFLMMSQGIPVILAGDEFLNTQNGNNNPYCQDNEVGWVVWKDTIDARKVYQYLKDIISLRQNHPVLRPSGEYRIMDYAACGYPDLSYHGEAAWAPRFDNHLRNIGVMVCGKYAYIDRLNEDDFFYIVYNMHWENHTFGLPKLPKGLVWTKYISTSDTSFDLEIDDNEANGNKITVGGRSITIIRSIKVANKVDKKE